MKFRPMTSPRTPCTTPRGSITSFLPPELNTDSLLTDIKEGEVIDTVNLRQPSDWEEYRMFVDQTGGPASIEEGEGEAVVKSAPIETQYGLNVLWLEKNIALGVDEIYPQGQRVPLTSFHLWPATDAWEDIKSLLESKAWISERDTINLLNEATEIITFWQESHSTGEAREKFPQLFIRGTEQIEGSNMDQSAVGILMADEEGQEGIDTSAIPAISLKSAPGFADLLGGKSWYRDPETEGPWDKESGKWKDVSIQTLEELHKSVPQKTGPK